MSGLAALEPMLLAALPVAQMLSRKQDAFCLSLSGLCWGKVSGAVRAVLEHLA